MSRKPASKSTGHVVVLEHDSKILAGNPLGDPHVRKVAVWLPPGYDEGAMRGRSAGRGQRFPVLFDLVGFTGSGLAHLNWRPFDENVPERVARLIARQRMGPTIVVFPDCFTSLGGNQYVNSSAIGRYADYLTRELIPFVDREFRTLASRDHRGVLRQVVRRLRRDHPRDALREVLGRHRRSLGRRAVRLLLLHRLAAHAERARSLSQAGGARRAASTCCATSARPPTGIDDGRVRRFLAARLGEGQAVRRRGARADESRDGRDLRSRSEGAARLPRCRSISRPAS